MFNLQGYGPPILAGTLTTLELSILTLVLSFVLGLIGASAKLSKNRIAQGIATVYTTIIRGVPDLVLMLLIFYSLQIWLNDLTDALNLQQFNLDPFTSGVITLGFIYGAYFTETFRGAFLAVPRGQMEAARSFGMRPLLAFIGLSDIIKATQDAGKGTFRTFYFSVIAGVVYLVLTTASNGVLVMLERRYAIGVRRAAL